MTTGSAASTSGRKGSNRLCGSPRVVFLLTDTAPTPLSWWPMMVGVGCRRACNLAHAQGAGWCGPRRTGG